jgi:hypothetical protein
MIMFGETKVILISVACKCLSLFIYPLIPISETRSSVTLFGPLSVKMFIQKSP